MYVTFRRVRVTIIVEESRQYQILCVSAARFIQHAKCTLGHYTVNCGLSGSNIIFHLSSQTAGFQDRGN